LFTGIGGESWIEAAPGVAAAVGVEIATVTIGPGADYEDLYGDWARLREVGDSGCLLVRPDNHVCFRSFAGHVEAGRMLDAALRRTLARRPA
jgi:2,4-dichlorophenol 6-monooxygenase